MTERRQTKRQDIEFRHEGCLTVSTDQLVMVVWMVENISPYGALIHIDESIDAGQQVELIYQDSRGTLRIPGEIRWSEDPNGRMDEREEIRLFKNGIAFDPDNADDNQELFDRLTSR